MTESARNTVQGSVSPGTGASTLLHRTDSGPAAATDVPDALSWEMAMARAAVPADAPTRSAMPGLADGGEWPPVPQYAGDGAVEAVSSVGTVSAPAQPSMPAPAQPPASAEPAHGLGEPTTQTLAADVSAGGAPQRAGTFTQEAFLEYRMRRIALGLEPLAVSARMAAAPATDPLVASTAGSLVQPVSLYAPTSANLAALPIADRPVANGLSMGELAVERVVQVQRGEQQAERHVAEQVNHRLHLESLNTPESLPLQTLKSV